jgi:putative PIN family toxin of toxin-antitoxin system
MRAVFDANVFISAFAIPGSEAERAVVFAHARRFELVTSVPILSETAQTLRGKFERPDQEIREVLRLLSRLAEIVRPTSRVDALVDTSDNRILECAVDGRADLIVTGDRHR